MIIACPACESRFTVDSARLSPEGRTVKCSRCGYRWRVDASGRPAPQPEPAVEAVERELPPGPSAREVLARHAEAAASIAPSPMPSASAQEEPSAAADSGVDGAAETENPESAEAGTGSSDGAAETLPGAVPEAAPAEPDVATAQSPGGPDLARLTPRQRQKLRDAQKRKSRLRVVLLFLLVLVSVAALVGLMKKGPQIERALQGDAQPVAPVPAEPVPPGQAGGQ